MKIDDNVVKEFGELLLQWYAEHGRELPWRDTTDPYRIWISEIILQQTRVAQGYDYFVRFMDRFATVEELAAASEDEVLKYWQGLGYYSRARNLHASARAIVALGAFPTTYEGVRGLRGVGEYTAAAICSFAYQQPYAVVDGNVYRVLSRYLGIDAPIDSTAGKKLFAQLADQLLVADQPATYNQAIMDFGALQCTPRSPQCASCPMATGCVAYKTDCVADLPIKERGVKVSHRYFHYFYVRGGGQTYLRKRQGKDIWQGLYEPPMVEGDCPWSEEEVLQQPQVAQLLAMSGATLTLLHSEVKHQLSHQLLHARLFLIDLGEQKVVESSWLSDYQLIPEAELERYAVPRLVVQLLERVERSLAG